MLDLLLLILAGGAGACVMLIAHQTFGLWRNPVICFLGGVLFTLLLSVALPMPDPLKFGATFAFGVLLFVLGRCEHAEQDTDTDTDQDADTDHQQEQEPYTGLLHPTVTEALRQRMAASE